MRHFLAIALMSILVLGEANGADASGTIEGVVTLPSSTAARPAPKPRYPTAASYDAGPPDSPAAIVYLEGTFPDAAGGAPAELAQKHYQFAPGLLPVRRGTTVRFPNLDDEYHSVFSYSKVKRFDLGRYAKGETPAELTFDEPGVVRLYCEIHDHMRGTILVLDTPYFQKTDADGRYRLTEIPPGRWTVKAWLEDDTVREQTVDLRDGATARIDFPAP